YLVGYHLHSTVFFFQAEDGIRDFHVTGVQTCALPIYAPARPTPGPGGERDEADPRAAGRIAAARHRRKVRLLQGGFGVALLVSRSEERRVGKECCSRWLA